MQQLCVSIIAAMSENHVIGAGNALPWHLPADLKHFKQLTLGKPVVMGRKTFQSIGRPLPGRKNIVISTRPDFHAPGCEVVNSLDAALEKVQGHDEVMIIGGAQLYRHALPYTQRMYLTHVHCRIDGDAWFPAYEEADWTVVERQDYQADERNEYDYSFVVLERI